MTKLYYGARSETFLKPTSSLLTRCVAMIHGPVCKVHIYESSCLYIQSYIFLHGQNDYTNIYHVLLYHLILQKLEM